MFYAAWNPPFILLLWGSTIVDWYIARGIYASRDKSRAVRRSWLVISVAVNIGFIGFFKYGEFLLQNWQALMASFGIAYVPPAWDIVLPVGISFYTFVTMSYTLDVYLGRAKPIPKFLDYALFVTFFPHLVAGPIVRPTQLVPQFADAAARRRATRFCWGLGLLMTLGLFQKVVIADAGLASAADAVFGAPGPVGFADAWLGTLAFSGQIFCDFAGYSTAAIGASLCLGFALPDNFRYAVRGDRLLRFLAALAHLAVHVAARLPLHPARRQSRQRGPHLRQPDADDAARRPLARRQLDLRRLGRPARPLSFGRALGPLADRRRGRPGGRLEPPRARAADVLPRQHHLGVLPLHDLRRRRARSHPACSASRRPRTRCCRPSYMIKVAAIVTGILVVQWLMRNVSLEAVVARAPWWLTGLVAGAMLFTVIVAQGSGEAFIYFQF